HRRIVLGSTPNRSARDSWLNPCDLRRFASRRRLVATVHLPLPMLVCRPRSEHPMSGFCPEIARSTPCAGPITVGCIKPTAVDGRSTTVTGGPVTSQNSHRSEVVHDSLRVFLDDLAARA